MMVSGPASAIPTELITNGGFEDPATSGWAVYAAIPGWDQTTSCGIEIQNNVAGAPHSGDQFTELDSHCPNAIGQDVATVPGFPYTVSLWFSARPGTSIADNVLQTSWNGIVVGNESADGTGLVNTAWNQYTYQVTGGPGTTTRLLLADAGSSNSLGTYVDDVSVTASPLYLCSGTLFDTTKAKKLGSTIPVKIQVCDGSGNNLSSASLIVNAGAVTKVDNSASLALASDSGQANSPDNNFRYDADLNGYIFNLSTKGLSSGTWKLSVNVFGGTLPLQFDIK
jgi:hypothetical protein